MKEEPIHIEVPGHAMLHLAPTKPLAKLVVKRWKDGRWSVLAYLHGSYEALHAQLVREMQHLPEDYWEYKRRRAARHVGE